MPKKKIDRYVMTLQIVWESGKIESVCSDSKEIRNRFTTLVSHCCETYVDGLREIRLLDNAGRCFRTFLQNF